MALEAKQGPCRACFASSHAIFGIIVTKMTCNVCVYIRTHNSYYG